MEETTGEITITIESDERKYSYEQLGVTYESTDSEIAEAMSSGIQELFGLDIVEAIEDGEYTVKRVDSSHNIYIFPKSTAGN